MDSLLSSIPFGSFLVYSPRGTSPVSTRSKKFCYAIKEGNPVALRMAMERIAADFPSTELNAVLGRDVALVPTPRSALLSAGALWPSRLIADALVGIGLASTVFPVLTRSVPVLKSSTQGPGKRPTAVLHYETITAETFLPPSRITLIDDVVTRGNTLLGAATRLAENLSSSRISAFALIRTMSFSEVESLVAPCVGAIRAVSENATREP